MAMNTLKIASGLFFFFNFSRDPRIAVNSVKLTKLPSRPVKCASLYNNTRESQLKSLKINTQLYYSIEGFHLSHPRINTSGLKVFVI